MKKKVMRITSKTLHIVLEHDVTIGNGSIEATLQHMVFISEGKDGKIVVDLDFCDIPNVKFMGMPVTDGYEGYRKFKKTMSELGIDIDTLMDEAASKLITDEEIDQLKSMYKTTVNS